MFQNIFEPIATSFRHRELLLGFVSRELKGRFAGTFAGIIWALLSPVASMLAYILVFSIIIRMQVTVEEVGTNVYWIYFLTGLFPWLIFSEGISKATSVINNNANLVTKVVFPVVLLPTSTVISSFIINGIGMSVLLIYLLAHGYLAYQWILIPVIGVFHFIMTLGLALILSSLCVYLRDINELIGIIIMLWFFSTPIIYPISIVPEKYINIIKINPIYWLVQGYRDIILKGDINLITIITIIISSVVMYILGSLIFMKIKNGFADVL
jgi:lipopolysaccharide transport system permease protein